MPDIVQQISDSNDDGMGQPPSYYWAPQAYLFVDNFNAGYNPSWRWALAIPQGQTIALAEIKLYLKDAPGVTSAQTGTWYGNAVDDAAPWANGAGNTGAPRGRTKTTATAPFNFSDTTPGWKTFDITSILQEVVNRPGWSSGNHFAIWEEYSAGPGTCRFYDRSHYDVYGGGNPAAFIEVTFGSSGLTIDVADSPTVTEATTVRSTLNINVADSPTVVDSPTIRSTLFVSVVQAIAAAEQVTARVSDPRISTTDQLSLTEHVAVSINSHRAPVTGPYRLAGRHAHGPGAQQGGSHSPGAQYGFARK